MSQEEPRPQRHDRIEMILDRKSGVKEMHNKSDRYTAVRADSRQEGGFAPNASLPNSVEVEVEAADG